MLVNGKLINCKPNPDPTPENNIYIVVAHFSFVPNVLLSIFTHTHTQNMFMNSYKVKEYI